MSQAFPCTQCGLCCQQVWRSVETQFLDRGDGICEHYLAQSRSCGIYDQRPDVCRVDLMYFQRYAGFCSWEDFVALNMSVCESLQSGRELDELLKPVA